MQLPDPHLACLCAVPDYKHRVSNRATLCSALLIALAGLWACWCDVALLWDGAYQFCCTLTAGRAFAYLSRFHSWVVWQPVTWLSHITGNLRLLKMAYGAPFCFAPLASVLLSWWIVHRHAPHLMLWALFGAALAPLPGQIFMINDSIFQMHLFWPVFLATFLPLSRPQLAAMLVLSLFQLSHPIGIGLCLTSALAARVYERWSGTVRGTALLFWTWWYVALALGGIWKLFAWPDAYAAREASVGQVWLTFRWGVLWWPGAGLLAAWAAAALFLWVRARPASPLARRCSRAALPLLLLTAACWCYWAADPQVWQTAISYRRWLVPMSMPFLLAAGWELWTPEPASLERPEVQRSRDHAGLLISAIFLLVLGLQSTGWSRLFHRLGDQVAATPAPFLRESDLSWTKGTPLDHWGLAAQILVVQGRQPRIVLWSSAEEIPPGPGEVALSPFNHISTNSDPRCWFNWLSILHIPWPPGMAPKRSAGRLMMHAPLPPPLFLRATPSRIHLDQ